MQLLLMLVMLLQMMMIIVMVIPMFQKLQVVDGYDDDNVDVAKLSMIPILRLS